jgi:hypothetical protein
MPISPIYALLFSISHTDASNAPDGLLEMQCKHTHQKTAPESADKEGAIERNDINRSTGGLVKNEVAKRPEAIAGTP